MVTALAGESTPLPGGRCSEPAVPQPGESGWWGASWEVAKDGTLLPVLEVSELEDGQQWSVSFHASGADVVKEWSEGPFADGGPLAVVPPGEPYAGPDGLAITAVVTLSDAATGQPLRHGAAAGVVVVGYGTDEESWQLLSSVTEAARADAVDDDEGMVEDGERVTTAVSG